ncbi:APC family permease [Rhodococcus sp. IEGM 1401]|uniref:APC family permease n=1 Tax=unclassified Rhodococcus (in: high G+C Gram-positive bacteria) TaxID=192944 RepID=UPI0022B5973B|nr:MULTISPECIES: APC family permease [unclassified Rhodococcus (in: high G+C Gram-positive bacteria)]MCZ4560775.1 APC family permease [Rhodococcus sp. IEGM 1401]MDI9920915.1 APC family permease [Rhodococcus sp. IEGM 1372]MDV8033484.1 APC family permease [Rhodococcus sp. IEGM 1414]MDV8077430.1 APC family permease [Rhodococcus sp. IEGM 1370]
MTNPPSLSRRLGLFDAIAIGVGSMVGAGVFAAFAPASAVAGTGLLIGLGIAAVVAFCNATSSAQLAAQYPTSGGTYIYGRVRLGEWPGFLAGWSFVIGKTASSAAMALVFAAYVAPAGYTKVVAVLAIVALTAVNYFGITRTAVLTKILVAAVLTVLVVGVVLGLTGSIEPNVAGLGSFTDSGWYGILQSAGLLFFAFAGYARIATLGEEVVRPERTIPRAIVSALGIALLVYAVIALTLLSVLGPDSLASSSAPLVDLVVASGHSWASPLMRIGAALAALGALLALIAGIGRTSLAMARHDDLPSYLTAVHPRYSVPHRAEITLAVIVCVLVLVVDLRNAISFSSFGVLLYYLVANLSAYTQDPENRRYPKVLQIVGSIGCVVLIATLPATSIAVGTVVVVLGVAYRLIRVRRLFT